MGPRGPVISAVVVDHRAVVTSPATGQVGGSGAARCGGNRSSECFDRYGDPLSAGALMTGIRFGNPSRRMTGPSISIRTRRVNQ